jgi:hypothetical protein
MHFRRFLLSAATLAILAACSSVPPLEQVARKPEFATVKLRVYQGVQSGKPVPVSDTFLSLSPNHPVQFLDSDTLCAATGDATLTPDQDTSSDAASDTARICGISLNVTHIERQKVDVEFVLSNHVEKYDDSGYDWQPVAPVEHKVGVQLGLNRPVEKIVSVGDYAVDVTYLEPLPQPVDLPRSPTTFQLIHKPFGF